MTQWNEDLECDLVGAIADVLENHGLHKSDADEESGWTTKQITEAMALLKRQISEIAARQ